MTMSQRTRSTTLQTNNALQQAAPGTEDLARLIGGRRSEVQTPPSKFVSAHTVVGTLTHGPDPTGTCAIALPDGDYLHAELAASCLLEPQVGDLVHVLVSPQRCWLLHVLQRANPLAPQIMNLGSGATHICAGVLHLQAKTNLHLQAQDLHTQAETLQETALRKQSDIRGWCTTRAAFVEVHAERQLNLFGGLTTLVSEKLLKVDSAQIHMG